MTVLRRNVSCQELVTVAGDYLEGRLPPRLRGAVDRHLATCASCPNYLAQLRLTIELTGHLQVDDVPDELLDVLEQAWIEHHANPDGP
jgi:anti-sigma factor RsiW